jgi:alpha-tubulin suppressor-like RCC1 family protein
MSGVLANKSISAVAAGLSHAVAIAGGQLFAWGGNANGQLGGSDL